MEPTVQKDSEVVQGRISEPMNWFFVQWGMESVKRNLQLLNESLSRMVVISSSLIGGALYFIKDDMIPRGPKIFTLFFFVGCLLAAVVGLIPYSGIVELDHAASIRKHKFRAIRFKNVFLWISVSLLIFGFSVSIFGLIAK